MLSYDLVHLSIFQYFQNDTNYAQMQNIFNCLQQYLLQNIKLKIEETHAKYLEISMIKSLTTMFSNRSKVLFICRAHSNSKLKYFFLFAKFKILIEHVPSLGKWVNRLASGMIN